MMLLNKLGEERLKTLPEINESRNVRSQARRLNSLNLTGEKVTTVPIIKEER